MTPDYLNDVCKPGRGAETCSYLASSGEGFICAKLQSGLRRIIDARRAQGALRAKGDNCEGDANFFIAPPITAIRRILAEQE